MHSSFVVWVGRFGSDLVTVFRQYHRRLNNAPGGDKVVAAVCRAHSSLTSFSASGSWSCSPLQLQRNGHGRNGEPCGGGHPGTCGQLVGLVPAIAIAMTSGLVGRLARSMVGRALPQRSAVDMATRHLLSGRSLAPQARRKNARLRLRWYLRVPLITMLGLSLLLAFMQSYMLLACMSRQ